MRLGRILQLRFGSLFRRSTVEAEMREELELHIEQLKREHMREGMSEKDALAVARREFGPVETWKEEVRDTRRVRPVEDFFRDARYALRSLRRSPVFSMAAIVLLAMGIGASTAIFSVFDSVLLRTIPVSEPQQLMEISRPGGKTLSYPIFRWLQEHGDAFSGMLATVGGRSEASLRLGEEDLGDVHYTFASRDYFSVVGAAPSMGRGFVEEDMKQNDVAVISHRLWQRLFAGRQDGVLGKAVRIGTHRHTVVGVAAEGFTGVVMGQPVDLWVPITKLDAGMLDNRVAMVFRVIARRKSNVAEEQAIANLALLGEQIAKEWKFEKRAEFETAPAQGGLNLLRRRFSRPLWVLTSIAALLLLMAAANLASLLLARAAARQREIGIRLSLGAGRFRVVRGLLAESVVLGALGGAAGLALAPMLAAFLVRFVSTSVGRVDLPFVLDTRVLGFACLVSMAVTMLFGLMPALVSTRVDISALVQGARREGLGRGWNLRRKLTVAQVALSCVMLMGAVLFARSLGELLHMDAGFRPENVLLLHVSSEGNDASSKARRYEEFRERLESVGGVRAAAFSSERLFSGGTWTESIQAPGFEARPGSERESVMLAVSPGYFRALGIRSLLGRDFQASDTQETARVAVVNEAMARYFFGTDDAVGRTFRIEDKAFADALTIVGVVGNAKYSSLKATAPRMVYLAGKQFPGPLQQANFAVWTQGDPEKLGVTLQAEARRNSPPLRVEGMTTQRRMVDGSIAQDIMLAQLSAFFGVCALLLVCVGLYGLTAYEVSRRSAEIGVRMALGSSRREVMRLVLGQTMQLVLVGVAVGLVVAVGLSRLLESLLFGVRGYDTATLLLTGAILVTTGIAAAIGPAWQAAGANPLRSLHRD